MATEKQLDTVTRHYLLACIWADAPEGTRPRPTKKSRAKARADCAAFIEACGPLFDETMARYNDGYGHRDIGSAESLFGHDFYLTRQGHGAGFWDRGLGELGDKLSAMCGWTNSGKTEFPETCPEFYRGWLYLR